MNKRKIFYDGIVELCIDVVNLSRHTVEENMIEAAFRCFDAAVNALQYAAERKVTDGLRENEQQYAQAQKLMEDANRQNAENEIQKVRNAVQEAWQKKLTALQENCAEQKTQLEQSNDDYAIIRNIGKNMLYDLKQIAQMVQEQKEQLSATEEMTRRNQKKIAELDEVFRKCMSQSNKLMEYYGTGGKYGRI